MMTHELTVVEYKALIAFVDGASISRPVRRRLLQAGALRQGPRGLEATPSAMASLIENAPRSEWTPETSPARLGETETRRSLAPRIGAAGAIMLAAVLATGGRR